MCRRVNNWFFVLGWYGQTLKLQAICDMIRWRDWRVCVWYTGTNRLTHICSLFCINMECINHIHSLLSPHISCIDLKSLVDWIGIKCCTFCTTPIWQLGNDYNLDFVAVLLLAWSRAKAIHFNISFISTWSCRIGLFFLLTYSLLAQDNMQRPLKGWLPEMCKHCGSLVLLNIALFVWVAWYVNFWLKHWSELKCKMVRGYFSNSFLWR